MKKILSFLLLFIFLYNTLGYYVIFKTLRYQVRMEAKMLIKQNLSDEELTLIKVPLKFIEKNNNILEWEKENEFKYKGSLYDVVKKIQKNDTIYFYCINDKKEEVLFANLEEHIRYETDSNLPQKKGSRELVKMLIKDYFFENSSIAFNFHQEDFIFNNFNVLYHSIPDEVISPPPKNFI